MAPLLKVSNVSRDFVKSLDLVAKFLNRLGQDNKEEIVHAVDHVSFELYQGEEIGIVGESGCGKSTLGKMIAGILPPTKGSVHFESMKRSQDGRPDALKTQMIFQDPFSSLNPRKKVIEILTEAPIHHGLIKASEKRAFALEMLNRVGLDSEALGRYPHQFSGGQRQRIGIARALAVSPELLVCDESIAALDVSIQAQVLNLFV
ncbi:MAG: ATP-binding cassette domain-containing protein, partial [Rhodobiaceae bacterium]